MIRYFAYFFAGVGAFIVFRVVYKIWGPSRLNFYEKKGTVASLHEVCLFCKIIHMNKKPLYQDDDIFIIEDEYPKATVHLLVLPKRHIKNLFHLKTDDLDLLIKMKEMGKNTIKNLYSGQVK